LIDNFFVTVILILQDSRKELTRWQTQSELKNVVQLRQFE
jgi:hypothetical protein